MNYSKHIEMSPHYMGTCRASTCTECAREGGRYISIVVCPGCQFEQHYTHLGVNSHARDCEYYKPVNMYNN